MKRLAALQSASENQAYAAMVSDITHSQRQQAEKDFYGSPSHQTSMGLNTLYTAAAVGAGSWLICRKIWHLPQWTVRDSPPVFRGNRSLTDDGWCCGVVSRR